MTQIFFNSNQAKSSNIISNTKTESDKNSSTISNNSTSSSIKTGSYSIFDNSLSSSSGLQNGSYTIISDIENEIISLVSELDETEETEETEQSEKTEDTEDTVDVSDAWAAYHEALKGKQLSVWAEGQAAAEAWADLSTDEIEEIFTELLNNSYYKDDEGNYYHTDIRVRTMLNSLLYNSTEAGIKLRKKIANELSEELTEKLKEICPEFFSMTNYNNGTLSYA